MQACLKPNWKANSSYAPAGFRWGGHLSGHPPKSEQWRRHKGWNEHKRSPLLIFFSDS